MRTEISWDHEKIIGTLWHEWEDDFRWNLKQVSCEGVDWMQLAWDSVHWQVVVNVVMNLSFIKPGSF